MATSKTLTPTNVTIQIPAFTDKPDQRANSNCVDKEADAINALDSKLANYHLVRCEYIEPSFTNGYAEYDLTSKLTEIGMSKAGAPIVTISGSAAQAAPCVRACDMAANKTTLKIALTTTYSGTVGCFVHFRAYN